jgi:hypothetical protein
MQEVEKTKTDPEIFEDLLLMFLAYMSSGEL